VAGRVVVADLTIAEDLDLVGVDLGEHCIRKEVGKAETAGAVVVEGRIGVDCESDCESAARSLGDSFAQAVELAEAYAALEAAGDAEGHAARSATEVLHKGADLDEHLEVADEELEDRYKDQTAVGQLDHYIPAEGLDLEEDHCTRSDAGMEMHENHPDLLVCHLDLLEEDLHRVPADIEAAAAARIRTAAVVVDYSEEDLAEEVEEESCIVECQPSRSGFEVADDY
jgi:hypothetical protein